MSSVSFLHFLESSCESNHFSLLFQDILFQGIALPLEVGLLLGGGNEVIDGGVFLAILTVTADHTTFALQGKVAALQILHRKILLVERNGCFVALLVQETNLRALDVGLGID